MRAFALILLSAVFAAGCSTDNIGYDASADPFAQLSNAKARARAERKLILVVAGGDWCSACHHLHEFLAEDAATQARLAGAFIEVHVYLGDENFNEEFFATLPHSDYVPHYWILSAAGTVLGEQDPEDLEFDDSDDFDPQRFERFVDDWKARTPSV